MNNNNCILICVFLYLMWYLLQFISIFTDSYYSSSREIFRIVILMDWFLTFNLKKSMANGRHSFTLLELSGRVVHWNSCGEVCQRRYETVPIYITGGSTRGASLNTKATYVLVTNIEGHTISANNCFKFGERVRDNHVRLIVRENNVVGAIYCHWTEYNG